MTRRLKAEERSGGATDYYRTPAWCVHRLAELIEPRTPRPFEYVDPCAGDNAILDALGGGRGYDLESKCVAVKKRDTLANPVKVGPRDVVVMNPPFSRAGEFVRAYAFDQEPWICAALLPLTWLGSVKRSWLNERMPDVWVLPNRPSFTPDGRTNSVDYAWMTWAPAWDPRLSPGRIARLPSTPKEERK